MILAVLLPSFAQAQAPYPVRMRIEQMSIRLRSAGPVPVQIRLEYNRPQILEGTLELNLYDARDVVPTSEKLATIRFEDIVLSGSDYVFNAILPPVQTSAHQNLAVQAWFQTKDERIPLSSSLKEVNPPEPHDLLMTNPYERGMLVCSCGAGGITETASANRQFLDQALSLENYNPFNSDASSQFDRTRSVNSIGRHIQHYAAPWAARDLPLDPMWFCCFDMVLLRDNALERLSAEQLEALLIWVRAGGSLCILPDGRLKTQHLSFVRTLFEKPGADADAFSTDDDGRLQVIGAGHDRVITNYVGLGRAALLPISDNVSELLDKEQIGGLVAFLLKLHVSSPVWKGGQWTSDGLLELLQARGIQVNRDSRGYYLQGEGRDYRSRESVQTARHYVSEEQLRQMYEVDNRLAPVNEGILQIADSLLLPEGVRMVPTWIIGAILAAYVVTIGPVDYFVLGYLRLRKATWVLFPIVTAFFTMLTLSISHQYMSSSETGGSIRIVDVVDDGVPIRESILQMLFYGSSTTHQTDHKSQLVVPANERVFVQTNSDDIGYGEADVSSGRLTTLNYTGHFPNSYQVTQAVQQWLPRKTRTFTLVPECPDLPKIDWNNPALVTTADGRNQLRSSLVALAADKPQDWYAVVLHRNQQLAVLQSEGFYGNFDYSEPHVRRLLMQMGQLDNKLVSLLPYLSEVTCHKSSSQAGFFSLISQVSPEGSAHLEDLPILDSADDKQWALIIVHKDANEYRVFRKLYVVETVESADSPIAPAASVSDTPNRK